MHYDFRLELDGVLLSWAVPKGPSFDPKDKRMASHVEDHPLTCGGFEGTIPPKQYGAGTVIVWDNGWWEPVGDPHEGLKVGKLLFHLHGQKMEGLWEGNKDYRGVANRAQVIRSDVVFFTGMDNDTAPSLQELRRQGVRSFIVGGDGICSSDLPRLAGPALGDERVLCAEAGGVTTSEADELKAFKEKFRKHYGHDTQTYAPYTYDAVMMLAIAMIAANSTAPQDYLPKLKSTLYTGVTGVLSFDGKGDLLKPAFTMMTFKGGQRVTASVVR